MESIEEKIEKLKERIKLWKGVNIHIVRQAKLDLRKLEKELPKKKTTKKVVRDAGILDLNKDGKVDMKDVKTFRKRVKTRFSRKKNK